MSHFPPASEQDWQNRIAKLLKGESFEAKLTSRVDDILHGPLYGRLAGPFAGKPTVAPWKILQRADHPKPDRALSQAHDDMRQGANGLVLVAKEPGVADGPGLALQDVPRFLSGLLLHAVPLRMDGGDELALTLARHVASQSVNPARLSIAFDCDEKTTVDGLRTQGFVGPFMMADGRMFHGDQFTDAEELGATLAWIMASLRKLEHLPDADLAASVSVTLAATQDVFVTLAKFRAMRLLWTRVLELCKLPIVPLALHGETSRLMMADKDPHTNMLRSVAATFGAGLGGATSFTVLPFSFAQGMPNAFARRMARNTQVILQQEAHLWRLQDAGAGAGYIEHLTTQLCERAWAVFQSCEKGDWPSPPPDRLRAQPSIGVTSHLSKEERPAEVEPIA